MTITRNRLPHGPLLALADLRDHARLMHTDDDQALLLMLSAAALEIEEAAGIALLPQLVTYETEVQPGRVIALPVGPAVMDASNLVQLVAEDGSTTTATGWRLIIGLRARVELAEDPVHRVRISYLAKMADHGGALPADLRHAILEQATRLFWSRSTGLGKVHGPALSPQAARVIARYRGVRA